MSDENLGLHLTRMDEVHHAAIRGGHVYTLKPLNIAYRDDETATVYVNSSTEEDSKQWLIDIIALQ
jgi:hypothetical protein